MTGERLLSMLRQNRLLLIALGVVLYVGWREPTYLRPQNLANAVEYIALNGILALGMTLLMIARSFDISIGSTMVLAGTVTVLASSHLPAPGAVLTGLATGLACGLVNGILVARFEVNSFIATLGTMVVFQGVAFSLTGMRSIAMDSPALYAFASARPFGVPTTVFYLLATTAAVGFLARFTRLGRYAYAIGSSPEACRRMGIPVTRCLVLLFLLSGLFAAFAGIVLSGKAQAASANFGENVAMVVIAAIVLGGVHLSGGVGTVWGVLQGVILIGLIDNVTDYMGVFGYYQQLFRAVILLGVIVYDVLSVRYLRRRQERQTLWAGAET